MSQAPPYNRQKNFLDNNPDRTDHGALNREFDRAAASINGLRDSQALLQNDDGTLRQGAVTPDSLSAGVTDEIIGRIDARSIDLVLQATLAAQDAIVNAGVAELARDEAVAAAEGLQRAMAWANVANNGVAALVSGRHIASATRTGAGVVRVVLTDDATSAAALVPVANSKGAPARTFACSVVDSKTVDITAYNGATATDSDFYLIVLGV